MKNSKLFFITLLMLISFASVNAVLFTPALPSIADYFAITHQVAQGTITWFLVGYAIGQLFYGPLANRFGRKPAIYFGIVLQILSSGVCLLAGHIHYYPLLIIGRFLLALGSAVGLKISFTMVNELYDATTAAQKISYLMIAFALAPGLAVAVGGALTSYWGWMSCFYAGGVYGLLLLFLAIKLPETAQQLDRQAFEMRHLMASYGEQFKNPNLIRGGFLMGLSTSVPYLFAALAPFVAMTILKMHSAEYGIANILPPIGLLLGSLNSGRLVKSKSLTAIIIYGIFMTILGVALMLVLALTTASAWSMIFLPAMLIYFGIAHILPNASAIAMNNVQDKSHAAAVMSFINMGTATIAVLSLSFFSITSLLMPFAFMVLCLGMLMTYQQLRERTS